MLAQVSGVQNSSPSPLPRDDKGNAKRADLELGLIMGSPDCLFTALDVTVRTGHAKAVRTYDRRTGQFDAKYHVIIAEKQKRDKYEKGYLVLKRGFIPFVVSSNGYIGAGANRVLKVLAEKYAAKHYIKEEVALRMMKMYISVSVVAQIAINCLVPLARIRRLAEENFQKQIQNQVQIVVDPNNVG